MLFPLIVSLLILFCFQNTVFHKMSDVLTVVALPVTAALPACLHDNAADCHGLVVEGTRQFVSVNGMYNGSDVVQSRVQLLVNGDSRPPLLDRRSLENNLFVPLIVHRLPDFPQGCHGFVYDWRRDIKILAWLHLRVDQILVANASSLLCIDVIFH